MYNDSPLLSSLDSAVFVKHKLILRVTKELLHWSCLLRGCLYQFEVSKLHSLLLYKIEEVTSILSAHECSAEEIDKVKFMLCAELDEAMVEYLDKGELSRYKSLTEYYYKELGGEHFFDIIAAFLKSPHANLAILSLSHIILCIGFKGQYALEENGRDKLCEIKDNLFFRIKKILPGPQFEIESKAQVQVRANRVYSKIRTRVVPVFLLILIFAYGVFYRDLGLKVNQLQAIIQDNLGL
jgi:type IV/VI secretion system ImpK/VasF family protein